LQIFKSSFLDEHTRGHLSKVYATLACTLLSCVVGTVCHYWFDLGGILTTFATLGLIILLSVQRHYPVTHRKFAIVMGIGFFKGCSIGPLLVLAAYVDPSLIVTALLATTAIFVCFSVSAILSDRSNMMYMYGLLSSCLSTLTILYFVQVLFFPHSEMLFNTQLYVGLLMFCGYVVVDTQMMLVKIQHGDDDYIWHSVELFIDFVAIFVRILVILLKDSKKKKKEKLMRRIL